MSFDSEFYKIKKEEYYFHAREEMLPYVPAFVKSVLDVGCSSGGFGKLLKDRGCEVWGIEPTDSAKNASAVLDRVYQDYFHNGLNFYDKKFDAIIFNDVLEHLVNPWEALRLAKSILNPNGCIIASIPNVQCYTVVKNLIKGEWKYESSGILDKTHYRFFTKKSISRLFDETGFRVEISEGQNSVLAGSRLLRFFHFFFPRKVDPFLYTSYATRAVINEV